MMKNLIVVAIATVIGLSACSKKHGPKKGELKETITSEQTVELKAGETITITLPTEDAHDAYSIVTQSLLASNSAVQEYINYTYTAPATLPVGTTTDEVVVSNDHHAFTIPHTEIPGEKECNGQPQHYTVKLHIT
jgi:uncharacterized lipoprotein